MHNTAMMRSPDLTPEDLLAHQLALLEKAHNDPYAFLNALRAWFNRTIQNYELILEDDWYADKTTIEYIVRSLDTFNLLVIGRDTYKNHQDAKGVWHLDDYVKTDWVVYPLLNPILQFVAENTPLQLKDSAE